MLRSIVPVPAWLNAVGFVMHVVECLPAIFSRNEDAKMDQTLLVTLISGMATIVAAVVGAVVAHVLDQRLHYPRLGVERRAALEGKWTGLIHQRRGIARDITTAWQLKTKTRRIQGKATIQAKSIRDGSTFTMCLTINGGLLHDRFLKAEYTGSYEGSRRDGVIQFGYIILELSMDGRALTGRFLGLGPITEELIEGTIGLKKVID